jgi:dolichol-phosphate mannosyltransferase
VANRGEGRTDVTVFLALPAYNEEKGLPHLFEEFRIEMERCGYPSRIVIVDDGSRDHTVDIILEWSSRLPVTLVRHSSNKGLGETIRDALQKAAEMAEGDDVIVTMDADDTHSPTLIPAMIRLIDMGNDVVIASRYRAGSRVVGLNALRTLTSYGARALFQIVFPISGVRDYTCGFRAYRAKAVQQAFFRYGDSLVTERGFTCMAEILLKLSKCGVKMSEVPMILRYDQKQSASKMKVASTIVKTLTMMAKTRFSA